MDYFHYQNNQLYAEQIPVCEIVAQFGTPLYIYSRATLERHYQVFKRAFADYPHRICYAVKANSNIAVLNLLARLGAYFDIVSVGELERVLAAGGKAERIVFSGVGKLQHEMRRAIDVGIACFNVESAAELDALQELACEMNVTAPISLRVNPDIDAKTHPYIATGLKENKFGIDLQQALVLYQKASKLSNLSIVGVDCHIGSQLTELSPFKAAARRVISLVEELKTHGITCKHIDLGGGLGVSYTEEVPPTVEAYADVLKSVVKDSGLELWLEPGRAIAANAGILVTQVIYLKPTQRKNFAVVDAAMNDLLRPALYQSKQTIIEVNKTSPAPIATYDVVGPVCETGDFLGKNCQLAIQAQDLLAIRTAGAYGFTMSSNYNTRPRSAEVMVDQDRVFEIRPRETIQELFAKERCLP